MLMNDTNAMNSSMSSLEEEGPLGGRRGKMRIPWVSGMRPGYGYDYGARAALSCPFVSTNINWPAASKVIDESDLLIERIESVEDLQEKLMIKKDVQGSYALFSGGISGQFMRTVSINNYSLYFLVKAYAITSEEFISASAYQAFHPKARGMSRGEFQNSFGDYFVEGRVRGSAFLALLEIKTQSEQVKMQVLEELNIGKAGGKSSPTFAATFGAQFEKAATHQGVSFALYVSEHGVGPEVINLAANIAPQYAASREYLRRLEALEEAASRELTFAQTSLNMWKRIAKRARKEADSLETTLTAAKTAETTAQTEWDAGKVEESAEYKALALAWPELTPLEEQFKAALREYELADEKLKSAKKLLADLEKEVSNAQDLTDDLVWDELKAGDAVVTAEKELSAKTKPKEEAEGKLKTVREKYSQELKALEASHAGKLQKNLEAAKERVIRLQAQYDDADTAATNAESQQGELESKMETLQGNLKDAKEALTKAEQEPSPATPDSPEAGAIRYRTLGAYDKCIERLIEAATRTKSQALNHGKDLYAIICPYSIVPNAPGVGRGFNLDRLDLIYERLDRAWRNAKLVLNSVNYALEMGNKNQFAESPEELSKIQKEMVQLLDDIHAIDRKLKRNPEASIDAIPDPPNLSRLPRRLWSTVKEKITPPAGLIPKGPLTSISETWNIVKKLSLPKQEEPLRDACRNYCQSINEGIRHAYNDITSFIDEFNQAWQEIRVVDPAVGGAKAELLAAQAREHTAINTKAVAETNLASARNAESKKGKSETEIEQASTVRAALGELLIASSELTSAQYEVNAAQTVLSNLQAAAQAEKLAICEQLILDLGRKKMSLESFIRNGQSDYVRLKGRLGDKSLSTEVRNELEPFKTHCESSLHKLLWDGGSADGTGNSLLATESSLVSLLARFAEKLKVLPADEPPPQYIELDTLSWKNYRGEYSNAARDWTQLI